MCCFSDSSVELYTIEKVYYIMSKLICLFDLFVYFILYILSSIVFCIFPVWHATLNHNYKLLEGEFHGHKLNRRVTYYPATHIISMRKNKRHIVNKTMQV